MYAMKLALILLSYVVCADSAAILLSLLKELQKQSQAVSQLSAVSSQWCNEASHQEVAMTQVIQGQLDDATIAVQQIRSDEKRLQSELTLATSTQRQREQQLQDASSTSSFAEAEFKSQQEQLNGTITACQDGMRLLKAQVKMDSQQQEQLGSADNVVNNLLQTSSNHMTEDEKSIMTEYVSDPKPDQTSTSGPKPQELLQTLTKLHARLSKEQAAAFAEQQVMSLRLWTFTDHLSSSIMESKSQAAAIGMEIAQRKREHTRLEAKIAALNGLVEKVETSKGAVTALCKQDTQQSSQIQKFIADESDSVRTTLKQMPALSSELLFDLSNVLPEEPKSVSFLQLRGRKHKGVKQMQSVVDPILKDLDSIGNKFPEDDAAIQNAKRAVVATKPAEVEAQSKAESNPADGVHGFASSSIQDIYAFLKSDDSSAASLPSGERMLLSNSGELPRITGVYQSLLDHVNAKENAVDDQLKWCGSIARDAKIDADAVSRSLKWTDAKLNLVRVAMAEYNRSVAFSQAQQKAIEGQTQQLKKLGEVVDGQLQHSYDVLKQYGQQLISLASQLEQKASPEDRKGADVVKTLLERVQQHQGFLQSWRAQCRNQRETVKSSFISVAQSLADGAKQSSRRMVRMKVESQVLASLTSSKAKDQELSEKYVRLSRQLCSDGKEKELQAKGSKLRAEAAAVQKSLTSLSQPAA